VWHLLVEGPNVARLPRGGQASRPGQLASGARCVMTAPGAMAKVGAGRGRTPCRATPVRLWRVAMRVWVVLLLALLPAARAVEASIMEVRPGAEDIVAVAGQPGGPFAPSQFAYTVRNGGNSLIDLLATTTQLWIALALAGVILSPGEMVTVTASIAGAAAGLAGGGYSDNVTFVNLTTDTFIKTSGEITTGPTLRLFTLNVFRSGVFLDQGFGAPTRGGAQGTVVRVTTLSDNGDDAQPLPGSLREALAGSNRYVVFAVGGEIALATHLFVRGSYLTIDGLTAPSPGITLRNYGLILRGKRGAHDVIVRGLRIRDIVRATGGDTQFDGIQVADGAFNIVVDGVSIDGADDGSVDVTNDSHDVTVSRSVLAHPKAGKNMLIKYGATRVTLLSNLLVKGGFRNPQVEWGKKPARATDTVVDMRNNLIWDFGTGTKIIGGGIGNVVANYYGRPGNAIKLSPYTAGFVSGNVAAGGSAIALRSAPVAFPAPPLETTDALQAACRVLAGAGARPLDDVDRQHLAAIAVPRCVVGATPGVAVAAPAGGTVLGGRAMVSVAPAAGIAAVRFFLDGLALGPEIARPPYTIEWDTATASNGAHTIHARARDTAGVIAVSPGLNVTVRNAGH